MVHMKSGGVGGGGISGFGTQEGGHQASPNPYSPTAARLILSFDPTSLLLVSLAI